jgi:RimJ/RimL family protein N-acetyltransferase
VLDCNCGTTLRRRGTAEHGIDLGAMELHTTIRDSIPADARQIFALRCDPCLKSMQYAPSRLETPSTFLAIAQPGPEIPKTGCKCSTILVDESFAGHVIQLCTTGTNGVTSILLGWDLVPELWGMGAMVRALDLLFDQRFKTSTNIDFIACCFASNRRCIRVIEKLGFQTENLTFRERVFHFIQTWGQERVKKHRLTYSLWRTRHAARIAVPVVADVTMSVNSRRRDDGGFHG